jgi:hypothetical protein
MILSMVGSGGRVAVDPVGERKSLQFRLTSIEIIASMIIKRLLWGNEEAVNVLCNKENKRLWEGCRRELGIHELVE